MRLSNFHTQWMYFDMKLNDFADPRNHEKLWCFSPSSFIWSTRATKSDLLVLSFQVCKNAPTWLIKSGSLASSWKVWHTKITAKQPGNDLRFHHLVLHPQKFNSSPLKKWWLEDYSFLFKLNLMGLTLTPRNWPMGTPDPRVTTRILRFLVRCPYEPSLATVTGCGVDAKFLNFK